MNDKLIINGHRVVGFAAMPDGAAPVDLRDGALRINLTCTSPSAIFLLHRHERGDALAGAVAGWGIDTTFRDFFVKSVPMMASPHDPARKVPCIRFGETFCATLSPT